MPIVFFKLYNKQNIREKQCTRTHVGIQWIQFIHGGKKIKSGPKQCALDGPKN